MPGLPTTQTTHRSPKTLALSRRAARRLLMRDWIMLSIRLLPVGLGVGLILVIADRWWFNHTWWWGIPTGCVVLSVLIAGLVSQMRRPDALQAAGWLDESAQTQSRYRSAMELTQSHNADPAFAMIAVDLAEQTAAGTKLPSGQPHSWHRRSGVSISVIVLLLIALSGIFMPTRPPRGPVNEPPSPIAIADAREHIQAHQHDLEELAEESDEADQLIADALEDLAALEEELTAPGTQSEPESARALTESRVEQLADDLEDRAEQQQLEEQILREQLDKLKSDSLTEDSDLDRFREQLSEGRYEDAIEELDKMNEALDSMSDQQREQIAEDLDSMADAIEPKATPDPMDQPESLNNPPESSDAEKLSEALKDYADQVRDQEPEQPEQPKPDGSGSPQDQEQQDSQQPDPDDQSKQQPDPEQPQGTSEQQQQDASESESDHQDDQQSREQPHKTPGREQSPEPRQQSTDNQSETDQSETDQSESDQPGSEQQPEPSQSPEQTNDRPQEQQPSNQPGDQLQQSPQQGDEQEQPQPGESGQEVPQGEQGESTLREMLEYAQRQADGAEQDRTMAERLREQIEESQGDQPQQPGYESSQNPEGQQGSGPGDLDEFVPDGEPAEPQDTQEFVPVQAPDDQAHADDLSTPIGQWYNPDADRPDPYGQSQAADRFRDAASKAREQIDDRRVPRRYRDVIREYFKKLDDRADAIEPSADGSDAPDPEKSSE